MAVRIVTAKRIKALPIRRTYSGTVKAARNSSLGFERTGRVVRVLVDEGTMVQRGDILAELDTRRVDARHQELQANYRAESARLEELRNGPRPEVVQASRAAVSELESRLQIAELDHQRNSELLPKLSISQAAYDTGLFQWKAAQSRLEEARQQLAELDAGTRHEQVKAQEARLEQLAAMLDDVQVERDDSQLTAPFDGCIAVRDVDEGTVVAPGAALFQLVESGSLEAWIGVPPSIVTHVRQNQRVSLQVENQVLQGEFQAVLPELDSQTRTQMVVFSLPKEDGIHAVPGQVVRAEIQQPVPIDGFLLPIQALTQGRLGLWSVFVVQSVDQQWVIQRRDVELLHTEGELVVVRGMLEEAEQVVADGVHRLAEGQIVTTHVNHQP
ncbi:MAG: efflux RND transporter periplasmic adaptor subunit [Pirellulaceae bacterium]